MLKCAASDQLEANNGAGTRGAGRRAHRFPVALGVTIPLLGLPALAERQRVA